jgi:two-component system chemotaxis response regulator CheY
MARLLVVEDSEEIRSNITKVLTGAGHTVVTAVDGQAGLEAANQGAYDAVITDVQMPRMDGIELVTRLRALTKYQRTPILVVSALTQAAMVRKGKAAGADAWMMKPVRPDHLLRAVQGVLKLSPT